MEEFLAGRFALISPLFMYARTKIPVVAEKSLAELQRVQKIQPGILLHWFSITRSPEN